MGMFLKSAVGLGVVYFAMFGPAIKPADIGPTASLCGAAAQARIAGDEGLSAQWAAAGCVMKIAAQTQRVAKAPPPKPAPPPPPAPPAPSAAKPASGTLTEADLTAPWFGPARPSRKSARRG
jgi:hypothetical protein